jgi:WD40 repeat protein
VWELPECAEPMHVCQGEQVWGAAFSADGKRLATCDEYGVGRLWKATGGGVWQSSAGGDIHRFIKGMAEILFRPGEIMKADGRIYGVAFSPDGRTVATAGAGGPGGSPVYGGMRPRGEPVRPGALNLWGLR